MPKKLIIANWKLNPPTLKEAQKLALQIDRKAKNKVVVCPPAIFLTHTDYPNLGAQDCHWEDKGAFTGQISPLQLKNIKIKYCIAGHSEKRALGDSDGMVNLKVKSLLAKKITPVLCVGFGTKVEQDDLEAVDVLKQQLKAGLAGIADPSKVIVAYEPVWAIGSGKSASAEHAEQMSIFIKSRFKAGKVLYGGSVNVYNAKSYLQQTHVDGLLVGGASLIAGHFNQIINY